MIITYAEQCWSTNFIDRRFLIFRMYFVYVTVIMWMKQHPIMMLTLSIIQNYKIKVQPLFVLSDIGKNLNETTPLFVSTGVEQSEQY